MKIENLDQFRDKMRWTTVTEDGRVIISVDTEELTGKIQLSSKYGYWIEFDDCSNSELFELAKVDKVSFMKNILGYTNNCGKWPWMKSTDDILKVLVELDKLYTSKESEPEIEKSKSIETEHPSIADMDFTPKKKHYSFKQYNGTKI